MKGHGQSKPSVTEAEQKGEFNDMHLARLAHERAMLDEARRDVEAGRVIADPDIGNWLDLFVHGKPLLMPDAPSKAHAN